LITRGKDPKWMRAKKEKMAHNGAGGGFIVSLLDIKNLSFRYGKRSVLRGVDLTLEAGQLVALLGPSGSGKTTLMRLIAGLMDPDQGSILLDGAPTYLGNPEIAYMVQEDLLLPWRDLLSNVTLPLQLRRGGRGGGHTEALELLAQLGLAGWERRHPHELSGGMRQRAALARTLLSGGRLLLLDEPFGALDLIRREQLYDLLLAHAAGRGVLVVTHDVRDALRLAHRIVIFGAGRILGQVTDGNEQMVRTLLQEAMEQEEAGCRY
jgi:ABC-type nitrate/sulfonate/bicarbonate transport system ATPase subunit